MAGGNSFESLTAVARPPQLRVVGFCAKSSTEASNDGITTSPQSVAESPLSRMLKSATWPCLRLRLNKNEISQPCLLASQTDCSAAPQPEDDACSASRHSVSSSPISIPRACSWMQDADPPAGLHLVSSAKEVSVLKRNVAPSRESPKAFKPLAGQKDLEDANFAEACWLLD